MTAINPFWSSNTENHILSDKEVHVWHTQLDQPHGRVEYLAGLLSKDEQDRADRFRFIQDRSRFIVGRAVLRILLGRYLALPPRDIVFAYKQCGKPELDEDINPIGLQFNLSHSHDLAIYAFASHRKLGIDLEYQHWLKDINELAARSFSHDEFDQWRKLPSSQQQESFYLNWTRKEAYLKAEGTGLNQSLDSLEAPFEPDGFCLQQPDVAASKELRGWTHISLVPAPGYIATLMVAGCDWQLACREYT